MSHNLSKMGHENGQSERGGEGMQKGGSGNGHTKDHDMSEFISDLMRMGLGNVPGTKVETLRVLRLGLKLSPPRE